MADTYREGKICADFLAKRGANGREELVIFEVPREGINVLKRLAYGR